MFETAHDYAEHLSTLISDDEIVLAAVRLKFPKYGKASPRLEERDARKALTEKQAYKKPRANQHISKFDGAYSGELTDASFKRNMAEGSHKLLSTLWDNHSRILLKLSENENCTVMRA